MEISRLLAVVSIGMVGLCAFIILLIKPRLKSNKAKGYCDLACSLLVFIAVVLIAIGQVDHFMIPTTIWPSSPILRYSGGDYTWKKMSPPTGKCITKKQSQSQLNQDMWVLEQTNCKKNGYYIDMGSHDGQQISNTAVLDNRFGWNGLCIDIHPKNMGNRTCEVVKEVLYDKSGKKLKFKVSDALGGITKHIAKQHRKTIKNDREKTYITKTAQEVFNEHHIPLVVDFLDMDVEGAELKILQGMEADGTFDKHCFKNIGVEHNHVEPDRSQIRNLLERNGYVYAGSDRHDDYYVNSCP